MHSDVGLSRILVSVSHLSIVRLSTRNTRALKRKRRAEGGGGSSKINGLFFNTEERGRKGDKEDRRIMKGKFMPTDRHQTSDRGPRAASTAAQTGV